MRIKQLIFSDEREEEISFERLFPNYAHRLQVKEHIERDEHINYTEVLEHTELFNHFLEALLSNKRGTIDFIIDALQSVCEDRLTEN